MGNSIFQIYGVRKSWDIWGEVCGNQEQRTVIDSLGMDVMTPEERTLESLAQMSFVLSMCGLLALDIRNEMVNV